MPKTKKWEEFDDAGVKRSESVTDKIDQILDTVTQLALKEDAAPEAMPPEAGAEEAAAMPPEAQEAPAEAPIDTQMPGADMPPEGGVGGEPALDAAPAGMPPTDGAPMEAQPEMPVDGGMPQDGGLNLPTDFSSLFGDDEGEGEESDDDDDVNKILDAAKDVDDPIIKQKLLAIAYEALDQQSAMDAAMSEEMPPEIAQDIPEELPPEAMGGEPMPGEGGIAPEVAELAQQMLAEGVPEDDGVMRGSKEGFAPMSDTDTGLKGNASSIVASKDKEEDKVEEPGVTDAPKDDEPEADVVAVEIDATPVNGEEQAPEEDEKTEAIKSILRAQIDAMVDKVANQVVEAVEGIDGKTSDTVASCGDTVANCDDKTIKRDEPRSITDIIADKFKRDNDCVKRSDEELPEAPVEDEAPMEDAELPFAKPENYDEMGEEDLIKLIAENFDRFEDEDIDTLISILDEMFGAEKVNEMFSALGINLSDIYEGEEPDGDEEGGEASGEHPEPDGDEPEEKEEPKEEEPKEEKSEDKEEKSEEKEEPKEEKSDDEKEESDDDKVERVGKHIPSITELMADSVARSIGAAYTAAPKEAASGQTVVLPNGSYNNTSISEMIADRMKK